MYIARFETDEGEWVQAAATLYGPDPSRTLLSAQWWDEVAARCTAASRIEQATVARRIALNRARQLTQLVVVSSPAAHEADVRAALARFTVLERLRAGSVEFPASRDAHDRWLADLPALQYSPIGEVFRANGRDVACDFRMAPLLAGLLADAAAGGHAFAYQVHVRCFTAGAEVVRTARRAAMILGEVHGAPERIVRLQERLSGALATANALVDEFVAVDSPAAASTAAAMIDEQFRAEYSTLADRSGARRFSRAAHAEAMCVAVHRHDLESLSPTDLCAAAVSSTERDRLFAWHPPANGIFAAANEREPDTDDERGVMPRVVDVADLPACHDGAAPFAFVSYKREDLPRIAPIMAMVHELGMPLWYDRGIPGGAEWDEVIEDRLARCRFVLFFASSAAVRSKYVRREVKFADARDTPVLSVLLEDADLAHGMGMLLTQYQMLDVRSGDFGVRLERAIGTLASRGAN